MVDLLKISTEQLIKTRINLRQFNGIILIGKNTIAKLAIKLLTEDDDPKSLTYPL